MGLPVRDLWIALNILVSASLYLFDFGTDVLALREMHHLEKIQNRYTRDHNLSGVFIISLSFMVTGHIIFAILLWLSLPPDEQPVLQTYFFPLMQLWRLGRLLTLTASCKGTKSLASDLKPLYNTLVTALQSSHQLTIQLYVTVFVPRSTRIMLSLMAGFISAAYSGGVAVSAVLVHANSASAVAVAMVAGVYVMSSLALRSLSPILLSSSLKLSYQVFLPFLLLGIAVNFLHLWFASSKWFIFSASRFFRCLGYSFVAVPVGPLYPMLKECMEENNRRGTPMSKNEIRIRLLMAVASHLLLDLAVFGASLLLFYNKAWWGSGCSNPCWKHLKEPYRIVYTGQFCVTVLPRFFYGTMLVILSIMLLMAIERDWHIRDDQAQCQTLP